MDYHFRSFAKHVVPRLVEQGIAVLGMKPMGGGIVLKSNTVTPIECLHYARQNNGTAQHPQWWDKLAGHERMLFAALFRTIIEGSTGRLTLAG